MRLVGCFALLVLCSAHMQFPTVSCLSPFAGPQEGLVRPGPDQAVCECLCEDLVVAVVQGLAEDVAVPIPFGCKRGSCSVSCHPPVVMPIQPVVLRVSLFTTNKGERGAAVNTIAPVKKMR